MKNIGMERLKQLARKLAENPDDLQPPEVTELLRIMLDHFRSQHREDQIRNWQNDLLR